MHAVTLAVASAKMDFVALLVPLPAGSSSPQDLRASLPSLESAASSTDRLSIGGLLADLPKLSVKLSAADEAVKVRCCLVLVIRRPVGWSWSRFGHILVHSSQREYLTTCQLARQRKQEGALVELMSCVSGGACRSSCRSDKVHIIHMSPF